MSLKIRAYERYELKIMENKVGSLKCLRCQVIVHQSQGHSKKEGPKVKVNSEGHDGLMELAFWQMTVWYIKIVLEIFDTFRKYRYVTPDKQILKMSRKNDVEHPGRLLEVERRS